MKTANPADVATPDALTRALYEAVSFKPGGEPDWARMTTLFWSEGMLTPLRAAPEEVDVAGFRARFDDQSAALGLRALGFHESELAFRSERYGRLVHRFSTYESRHLASEPPFTRGINSIQMIHHEGRWWVLSIAWESEATGPEIPGEYLR